ncbi:MAG: MerR family transcriptional regulator, partial [Candidatus Dependentiae bacterium]
GLLTPSLRTDADYRVYTAADLLRLQQIVAFKSFGLSLKQIQGLLGEQFDPIELLQMQYDALRKKVASLQKAVKLLKAIIREGAQSESVEVETILQLMRVYDMKKQIEKTWLPKVLTKEQIERYAQLCGKTEDQLTTEDKAFIAETRPQMVARAKEQMAKITEENGGDLQKTFTTFFGRPNYDEIKPEVKEQIFKGYRHAWPDLTDQQCEDMFAISKRAQKEESTYLKESSVLGAEAKKHMLAGEDPAGPAGRDIAQRHEELDRHYYRGYDELYEVMRDAKSPSEPLMSEEDRKTCEWVRAAREAHRKG